MDVLRLFLLLLRRLLSLLQCKDLNLFGVVWTCELVCNLIAINYWSCQGKVPRYLNIESCTYQASIRPTIYLWALTPPGTQHHCTLVAALKRSVSSSPHSHTLAMNHVQAVDSKQHNATGAGFGTTQVEWGRGAFTLLQSFMPCTRHLLGLGELGFERQA